MTRQTQKITIRLLSEEKALIDRAARRTCQSQNTWVTNACLAAAGRHVTEPMAASPAFSMLLREVLILNGYASRDLIRRNPGDRVRQDLEAQADKFIAAHCPALAHHLHGGGKYDG